jgi:hypothetical protein
MQELLRVLYDSLPSPIDSDDGKMGFWFGVAIGMLFSLALYGVGALIAALDK